MRKIFALASIGLLSAPAFGEEAMPAPKPSEEMTALAKTMVGVWSCDAKSEMGGKEMKYKVKSTFTSELNGFVIAGKFEAMKMVMGREMLAFDSATKLFTRTSYDAFGGISVSTSKGPEGAVMTWAGKGSQMGMPIEETMTVTHKGPNATSITGTQKGPGEQSTTYELTCKR